MFASRAISALPPPIFSRKASHTHVERYQGAVKALKALRESDGTSTRDCFFSLGVPTGRTGRYVRIFSCSSLPVSHRGSLTNYEAQPNCKARYELALRHACRGGIGGPSFGSLPSRESLMTAAMSFLWVDIARWRKSPSDKLEVVHWWTFAPVWGRLVQPGGGEGCQCVSGWVTQHRHGSSERWQRGGVFDLD